MDYIREPPPAYVRPYEGPLRIIEGTAAEVERVCRDLGVSEGRNVLACSWPPIASGGECLVVLPVVGRGGVGKASRAALERHEINGHCAGWPKDHPR